MKVAPQHGHYISEIFPGSLHSWNVQYAGALTHELLEFFSAGRPAFSLIGVDEDHHAALNSDSCGLPTVGPSGRDFRSATRTHHPRQSSPATASPSNSMPSSSSRRLLAAFKPGDQLFHLGGAPMDYLQDGAGWEGAPSASHEAGGPEVATLAEAKLRIARLAGITPENVKISLDY